MVLPKKAKEFLKLIVAIFALVIFLALIIKTKINE